MQGRNRINKEDNLLTTDSKALTYEGKVRVLPGSSWFIIENQTEKDVEFHLQCFAPSSVSTKPEEGVDRWTPDPALVNQLKHTGEVGDYHLLLPAALTA